MECMKAAADGGSSDSGADTFGAGAGFPLAGDDPCDAGVDLQASRAEGRAGHGDLMGRRQFVAGAALAGFAVAGSLVATGCSAGKDAQQAPSDQQPIDGEGGPAAEGGAGGAGAPAVSGDASGHKPLPAPEADPESPFGVDANVNVGTIDQWLGREDVAYRDMRLFFDPADYAFIGGDPNLTATVEGFKVVPFPYLATLPPLPVANAYDGQTAWTVEWADDGSIVSATPNFRESGPLLDELFPKDKAIFLMCGAGGYAGQAKTLLVHLGWNADKLYNIGGFWNYTGDRAVQLITTDASGQPLHCMWRADTAPLDFAWMHAR